MNTKYLKTVALLALLLVPAHSFAFVITELNGDTTLTSSIDALVDELSTVTNGFTFETYHLDFEGLVDSPLTKTDAAEIYGSLDLHVSAKDVKEVPMRELYDHLVDHIHLAEVRPQRTLGHLHTLVSLFLKNKGCPMSWQVFQVIFYTEDSAFFEYIALHRPTGTMYVIELGV